MLVHMGGSYPDTTEQLQTDRFTVTIADDDREDSFHDKVVKIDDDVVAYLRINEHSVHLYDRSSDYVIIWPNSRREWEFALAAWIDENI